MRQGSEAVPALMGWIGGKRLLRSKIAEFVPEQDLPMKQRKIKYYVEVFGGMAWMLLYKPRWFESEIYNDANGDLVNLFNVVKFHPREFERQFRLMPQSQWWYDYFHTQDRSVTDIQRAVAAYVKYAWSYSGKGKDFAIQPKSTLNLRKKIRRLSARLDRVTVTDMGYERLVKRFDRANAFLYLDPPYFGHEYVYEMPFGNDDHLRLRSVLEGFDGKWLLSYNDRPEIRELYRGFRIEEVDTRYSALGLPNGIRKTELIIMNYEPF